MLYSTSVASCDSVRESGERRDEDGPTWLTEGGGGASTLERVILGKHIKCAFKARTICSAQPQGSIIALLSDPFQSRRHMPIFKSYCDETSRHDWHGRFSFGLTGQESKPTPSRHSSMCHCRDSCALPCNNSARICFLCAGRTELPSSIMLEGCGDGRKLLVEKPTACAEWPADNNE